MSRCYHGCPFDTYYDVSLENFKQSGRLGNAVPAKFTVDDGFLIGYAI